MAVLCWGQDYFRQILLCQPAKRNIDHRYSLMFTDIHRYSQIFTDIHRYSQVTLCESHLSTSEHFQDWHGMALGPGAKSFPSLPLYPPANCSKPIPRTLLSDISFWGNMSRNQKHVESWPCMKSAAPFFRQEHCLPPEFVPTWHGQRQNSHA